jgi:hypothetical protein
MPKSKNTPTTPRKSKHTGHPNTKRVSKKDA